MKNLLKIARFISNHPLSSRKKALAFKRLIAWQISQKLVNHPVLYPFIENSVLLVQKGMAGATGNIYTGLHEFYDMAFVIHALREGDLFGDIGANIGAYTILASKNVGARTISVEPIASTFAWLKQNVALNQISGLVTLFACGAGREPGVLRFTSTSDTVNHVVSEHEKQDNGGVVEVPIKTLDEIFAGESPVILKMDIEGFEWPALQGGAQVLGSPSLKALIIELNGCGGRYGYSDEHIHQLLSDYGFRPYHYDPFSRKFSTASKVEDMNILYIRDLDWAISRCEYARKFNILQQEV